MSGRVMRPSSQQRRDALVAAALEVIAEGGFSSVSNRTVTEKAGLPLSSVGYYFDSVRALADEAFEFFADEHVAKHEALIELLGSVNAEPDEIIEAVAASAIADRSYSMAVIESYLRAARHEPARARVERQMDASRELGVVAAKLAGAPEPEWAASSLYALLLGAALQRAAVPESIDTATLAKTFRTLLIGALYESGDKAGADRLCSDDHEA